METQQNQTLTIFSRHTEEIVLATYLLLSFLLCEVGNTFILVNIYKRYRNSAAGETLAMMALISVIVGIFVLLPTCITLLSSEWLKNQVICSLQGFLNDFVWTMLAFALLSATFIRGASLSSVVCSSGYRNNRRKITIGLVLLTGVCCSLSYQSAVKYEFLPEQFSCGVVTGNRSVIYTTLTFITPCCCTLCFTTVTLIKTVCASGTVVPAEILPALSNNGDPLQSNSQSIRRTTEKEKQTTKALAYVHMLMSASALLSTVFRLVGDVRVCKYEIYMKIGLAFLGVSCMVQPLTVFILSKPMRKTFLELFIKRSDDDEPPPFRTTASTFIGRKLSRHLNKIPSFLRSHSDISIQLTFPSNVDLNAAQEVDFLRRVSTTLSLDRSRRDSLHVRVRRSHSTRSSIPLFNASDKSSVLENCDDDSMDSAIISVRSTRNKRICSNSCVRKVSWYLPTESPVQTESSGVHYLPSSSQSHSRRRKTLPALFNDTKSSTTEKEILA